MKSSKRFVMLGMGSFGTALARKLASNGCQVIGVDSRKDRLEGVKNEIHECVVGDATDREVLENLPLRDASAVFISLGETISRSLLATLHVKELGARQVVVKGVTKEHGKILGPEVLEDLAVLLGDALDDDLAGSQFLNMEGRQK